MYLLNPLLSTYGGMNFPFIVEYAGLIQVDGEARSRVVFAVVELAWFSTEMGKSDCMMGRTVLTFSAQEVGFQAWPNSSSV